MFKKMRNILHIIKFLTKQFIKFQRLKRDYDKVVAEKNDLHRQCFAVSRACILKINLCKFICFSMTETFFFILKYQKFILKILYSTP